MAVRISAPLLFTGFLLLIIFLLPPSDNPQHTKGPRPQANSHKGETSDDSKQSSSVLLSAPVAATTPPESPKATTSGLIIPHTLIGTWDVVPCTDTAFLTTSPTTRSQTTKDDEFWWEEASLRKGQHGFVFPAYNFTNYTAFTKETRHFAQIFEKVAAQRRDEKHDAEEEEVVQMYEALANKGRSFVTAMNKLDASLRVSWNDTTDAASLGAQFSKLQLVLRTTPYSDGNKLVVALRGAPPPLPESTLDAASATAATVQKDWVLGGPSALIVPMGVDSRVVAVMQALRSTKPRWTNATTAVAGFLNEVNKKANTVLAAETATSAPAKQSDQRSNDVKKKEKAEHPWFTADLSSGCYWLARLQVLPSSDLAQRGVRISMISTCGVCLSVTADTERAASFFTSTATFGLLMLVAGVLKLVGALSQFDFVNNSTARQGRMNVYSLGWTSFIDFTIASLLSSLATQMAEAYKAVAAAAFPWFFGFCYYSFRMLTDAIREHMRTQLIDGANGGAPSAEQLAQLPYNVLRAQLWFFMGSLLLLGVMTMSAPFILQPVSLVVILSGWYAQIVFNVKRLEGKALTPRNVVFSSLAMTIVIWYFFAYQDNFAVFRTSVGTALLLTVHIYVQACILLAQWYRGALFLLPKALRPKTHSYEVAAHTIAKDHPSLLEDAECPICKTHMMDNAGAGAEAASSSSVWVTPCGHYYHGDCLKGWMDERHECPICRAQLPKYIE